MGMEHVFGPAHIHVGAKGPQRIGLNPFAEEILHPIDGQAIDRTAKTGMAPGHEGVEFIAGHVLDRGVAPEFLPQILDPVRTIFACEDVSAEGPPLPMNPDGPAFLKDFYSNEGMREGTREKNNEITPSP